MSYVIGIYGYAFTKPFSLMDLEFRPLYEDFITTRDKAGDNKAYNLTGCLLAPLISLQEVHAWQQTFLDLEAGLTFAEQQHVALFSAVELKPGEDVMKILRSEQPHKLKEAIPVQLMITDSLTRRTARPSYGECLQLDVFDPDMRTRLLGLLMSKLQDQAFLKSTGFRSAFFRNVEMVKMGNVPIDVTYSLLFTGLELTARKVCQYEGNNLPRLLEDFLNPLGFAITTDEANKIAACRNALFHRGEYETSYQHSKSNSMRTVKLSELPSMEALFTDVLLKVLGFDDQHINWNRWRDRMAFC